MATKKKLISKENLRILYNKLLENNKIAAIAENPAVMTASGWTAKPNGLTDQDNFNSSERNQLANNLKVIGEAGITAPTVVKDVLSLYNVVRHPKTIYKTGKDIAWFLRHPRATKVYHGTYAEEFNDLRDAIPFSENNVGIHVSSNQKMAEHFTKDKNKKVLSAWIPRRQGDLTTIDLGQNNHNWLSNEI